MFPEKFFWGIICLVLGSDGGMFHQRGLTWTSRDQPSPLIIWSVENHLNTVENVLEFPYKRTLASLFSPPEEEI